MKVLLILNDPPYGTERWQTQTALRLGFSSSLRPRGRPRTEPQKAE